MDASKVIRIIKVCVLVAQMPSGGGWTKSSEIVLWSAVPQATTYRYLKDIVALGYLQCNKQGYRNGFINHYKVTQSGLDYLNNYKELFQNVEPN